MRLSLTEDGTLLAPAATLPDPDRLGEKVVLFSTTDGGKTWPNIYTVFSDPDKKKGFFEQKLVRLDENRLLAVAWTVTLEDYNDLENHFAVSKDNGQTWSSARSTGIQGQTMTPIPLGGDRLLLLSNRRYGKQGVVMYLARFSEDKWAVESENMHWDANASRSKSTEKISGIGAFDDFAFGLPSAIKIDDNTFLAVHWCKRG